MPDEHGEWEVLRLALPYLGSFTHMPRRVREENGAEHAGHTFDFVATRLGGASVAIEVTGAKHESFQHDVALTSLW
jgi:hypothetical protein